MCVIILPHKDTEIPFEDLESACITNPDGYGIAVVQNGKVEIIRSFTEKGTDPEELAKRLSDLKNEQIMIHLRFATQGDRNIDNCHPFVVTKKDKDGIDIAFCHNGTFYSYPEIDKTKSDTWHMNEGIFKDLFKRTAKALDPSTVLTDSFVQTILEKYRPHSSLLAFIDGNGETLTLGKGAEMPFGWASNKYSFNRFHRTPAKVVNKANPKTESPFWENDSFDYQMAQHGSYSGSDYRGAHYSTVNALQKAWSQAEKEDIIEVKEEYKIPKPPAPIISEDLLKKLTGNRKSFIEIAGLVKLQDVCCFEPADIEEMVYKDPDNSTILILDLLAQCYLKDKMDTFKAKRAAQAANEIMEKKDQAA